MPFLPKTFNTILATLTNYFVGQNTGVTDLNVGSVIRSVFSAVATEQERIYMQMYEGIVEAIDTSAYNSFGFGRLAATPAIGQITLTRTGAYAPDITINTGTQFRVPATTKVYAANATTIWTGGAGATTITITVVCTSSGTVGNTPANTITEIVVPLTGVASLTNAKPLINGTDDETLDARRQRFASYVASLPRATRAAVEYGALTVRLSDVSGYVTELVAKAHGYEVVTTSTTTVAPGSVIVTPVDITGIAIGVNLVVDSGANQEIVSVTAVTSTTFTATYAKSHGPTSWTINSIGYAAMYIHNGVGTVGGTTTSGALVTAVQGVMDGTATVPGYKAAGVKVTAIAATEVDTTISIIITSLLDGYNLAIVRGTAITAVKNHVQSLQIAQTLRTADLTTVVRNVNGVRDCIVVLPASNVTAKDNQLIVTSTVNMSQFIESTGLDVNII